MTILDKLLADIEKHKMNAVQAKNGILLMHLNHVARMLEESKNPKNQSIDDDKLYEVARYIETIQTQQTTWGFFKDTSTKKTLADVFAEKGQKILPQSEHEQQESINVPALPYRDHEILGQIYKSLWQIPLKVWSFSYPKNEKGEVINNAIGEWQSALMKLSETPNKAFLDFHRNIGIEGTSAVTEEHMDYLLWKLVARANYPVGDRAILIQWLKSNGGQENNRFIDLLLMSKEFTAEMATNFSSISTKQNWSLREGKIVFECDVTNYALGIEGNPYVNKNTQTLEEATIDELLEFKENIKHGVQKTGILPMLRFKADVELHINDEKRVEPRIVELDVTSYNEQLTSPERLYKAEEIHEDRKEEGPRM